MPSKATQQYDAGNLEAARVIVERPDVYAGAVLEWARRFLKRYESENPGECPAGETARGDGSGRTGAQGLLPLGGGS